MSLELCFFRHGRTYWNAEGRYQGIADVDLDDLGWRQGRAVARRSAEMKPVALYSSDLKRCHNVAKLVSETTGIDVVTDKRLRERDVGTWSGKTRAEVAKEHLDDLNAWMAGDEGVRPGGGESVNDVIARVESFVGDVVRTHDSGTVIVVTHAAWIRHALHWVFGPEFPRRRIGVPSQASLTVLRVREEGMAVEAFNDRGHLLEVEDIDREGPAPAVY